MTAYSPKIYNIIREAFEQIGIDPQGLPDYAHKSALRSLNLLLGELANNNPVPQWMLCDEPILSFRGGDDYNELVFDDNFDTSTISKVKSVIIELNETARHCLKSIPITEFYKRSNVWSIPSEYFYNQLADPVIKVWPFPDKDYVGRITYIKTPDELLSSTSGVQIPPHWLNVITTGLAAKQCIKVKDGFLRKEGLDNAYMQALAMALQSTDDTANVRLKHGQFKFGNRRRA